MTLSICAIFRNEAPYLREWIEFHRIVGVDRFYLYQNNSDDEWEPVLRSYIAEGIVELTDWPVPAPAQIRAYHDFIERHKGKAGWTAFIDCDEFLFSPKCATVTEVLGREPFRNFGAVGVYWMCFGASGRERWDPAPVIERFTLRPRHTNTANAHAKCIVRLDCVTGTTGSAHRFRVTNGTFDERGNPLDGRHGPFPSHEWLRINHYLTKSREEFLKRIAHGRVDMPLKRAPREFDLYQEHAAEDREALRFLPELERRLEKAA